MSADPAALLRPEKRYKALKWLLTHHSTQELNEEAANALVGAVSIGLEEKTHKMNLVALDILEAVIVAVPQFVTAELYRLLCTSIG